jgi:hypothetical protein
MPPENLSIHPSPPPTPALRFAICANGNDAALVVGRGDAKLQASPIKYVSLQAPYMYYLVNVNDVLLNGQSIVPA